MLGTVRPSENQRINHALIWSRCNASFTQLPRAKPVACHCCQAIGAIFYSLMLLTVLSLICCTADNYAAADMWEGEYIAYLVQGPCAHGKVRARVVIGEITTKGAVQ